MSDPDPCPPEFRLENDARGRLVLIDSAGVRHAGAEVVRGFPVSDPDRFIAICNAEGEELVSIDYLSSLRPELREVIERELARREFVPEILRIQNVSSDSEPSEWEVETDRGATRFTLNNADDVRRLGPSRVLIIDDHGMRYLIEDARKLDKYGRRIIDHYL